MLQVSNYEGASHFLYLESDLDTHLDRVEHRRIFDPGNHRHARHFYIRNRAMLERNLVGIFVDLADFTLTCSYRCRAPAYPP